MRRHLSVSCVALILLCNIVWILGQQTSETAIKDGSGDDDKNSESSLHELHPNGGKGRSIRRAIKLWEWNSFTEAEIKTHRVKTLMLLFHDQTNPEASTIALAALEAAANEFAKHEILHISVERENMNAFQFFLQDEEESDFPFSVILEVDKGFQKYRLSEKPLIEDNFKQFERSYFNGELVPWIRSDDEPEEDNDDAVKTVVGSSFERLIMNSEEDCLVFLYAPWCGHCKKFEPNFKELAEYFIPYSSIKFYKMDIVKNDVLHPEIHVHRVPYVRLFPAKRKENPVVFDHSQKSLQTYGIKFLQDNCDIPLVNSEEETPMMQAVEL